MVREFVTPEWLGNPPEVEDDCEECEGDGCFECDPQVAADFAANLRIDAMREEGNG